VTTRPYQPQIGAFLPGLAPLGDRRLVISGTGEGGEVGHVQGHRRAVHSGCLDDSQCDPVRDLLQVLQIDGWRTLPEMAGAGLWTTPADLVRLELEIARAAVGGSALLGQDLAEQMLSAQVPGGMGLGTEVDTSGGYLRFGYTGSNVGYGCFSFGWPRTGAAVAVMANSEGAEEILRSTLAAAERQHAPPPDPAGAAAPGDLAGQYLLREDYPVDILASDGHLTLTAPRQHPVDLLRLPGGRYQVPGLDCEITFEDTAGRPVMRIRQENTTQTAARKR
jgi:hypothetical protein